MRNALLVLWVALLSATRIDLLGGAGPLVLTPFLVLSPVVLAAEAWRLAEEGWELEVPRYADHFVLATSALLALLLVSTFASYDVATSARRFALLLVQVAFVLAVGLLIANRPDPRDLLLKGAYAGLGLSLLFDLGQLLVWFRDSLWPDGLGAFVDMDPRAYLVVIPRFTGLSHDPNLGGLALVFYLGLVILLGRPSRLRTALVTAGALAVAATLSRSAGLAGVALWGGLVLSGRGVRVTPAALGWSGLALGAVTALYLAAPGTLDPLVTVGDALSNRFSLEEGSTSEHLTLFTRGWEVGTRDVKHALMGIGYGSSYVVLQDIFPGNEYGNFHSLFVTLFAEAGLPAALLGLWLFGHVLLKAGPLWPLVAALLAFNLFQQAHADPVFWLILLMAWLGVGVGGGPAVSRRPRRGPPAAATAALAAVLLAGCSDVLTEPFDYGTVETTVERRSGDGVAGAELTLFTGTRHLGFATTDARGRAVFDFVPFGPLGVAVAIPDGFRPLDLTTDRHRIATFRMEEGEEEAVSFTLLKEGPGAVEVRVADTDDEAAAGVGLELFSPDTVEAEGRTGDDGLHTFEDVPIGAYGVRVRLDRRFVRSETGTPYRDGLIVDEGWVERVAFTLERCEGAVRARAAEPDGTPVPGVPLVLFEPEGVVEEASTGDDGTHTFAELPCGDYGVRVGPVEGYRLVSPPEPFVDGLVVTHEAERTAAFTFEACRGTIAARVVDEAGEPVEGAGLELFSPAGVLERVETGADGAHDFEALPCGRDYGVRVFPPEGYAVEPGRGSRFFDGIHLLENGAEERVTFTLSGS